MKEYSANTVNGESMQPALLDGDFFIFRRFKEVEMVERGDIILFWKPNEVKGKMIKRIVGLPGEKITYKNGVLTVEKEGVLSIIKEPYIQKHSSGEFNWELGIDDFIVLGDNRTASQDSRVFGSINRGKIIAKIVGRLTKSQPNGSSYKFFNWE